MIENISVLSDNLQKSPYRRLFESPVAMPGVLRSHVIPPTLGTTLCISFSGSTTSRLELEPLFSVQAYPGMLSHFPVDECYGFPSQPWQIPLPIPRGARLYAALDHSRIGLSFQAHPSIPNSAQKLAHVNVFDSLGQVVDVVVVVVVAAALQEAGGGSRERGHMVLHKQPVSSTDSLPLVLEAMGARSPENLLRAPSLAPGKGPWSWPSARRQCRPAEHHPAQTSSE